MPDLDLWQAAEPKTCGTCGACANARDGRRFCELSCCTVDKTAGACSWWYAQLDASVEK